LAKASTLGLFTKEPCSSTVPAGISPAPSMPSSSKSTPPLRIIEPPAVNTQLEAVLLPKLPVVKLREQVMHVRATPLLSGVPIPETASTCRLLPTSTPVGKPSYEMVPPVGALNWKSSDCAPARLTAKSRLKPTTTAPAFALFIRPRSSPPRLQL